MTKSKFQSFSVSCPLYNYYIYFCIGDVEESRLFMQKKIDRYISPDRFINADGMTFISNNKNSVCVWILNKPKTPWDIAVVAHEIFHVVCDIAKTIGLDLNNGSEEAFAYLVSFITCGFYNKIK